MLLPFRREALRERTRLDEVDEADAHDQTTPSERIERCLELSDLARELAGAVGSAWIEQASASIEEKARIYVAPLRAVTLLRQ
jgi:hypothetical protein